MAKKQYCVKTVNVVNNSPN